MLKHPLGSLQCSHANNTLLNLPSGLVLLTLEGRKAKSTLIQLPEPMWIELRL